MKYLYTSPLPESAQTGEQNQLRQELSQQGLLGQQRSAVEQISSGGGDLSLDGQYRYGERISRMLAGELSELAGARLGGLPLYQDTGGFSDAGYYTIKNLNVDPVHANRRDVYQYDLTLIRKGTRSTHRREVTTEARELTHPFGNDVSGYVAAPATAEGVRWLNPETDATTTASPTTTRSAELGDIDEYRLSDAPYASPSLVYDIDYDSEGATDVRVFDSLGGSKLDADGNLRWAKVFDPSHEFSGEAIVDNGLVRLRADPTASPGVSVEQYDYNADAWNNVSLPASDWSLVELDIAERQSQRLGAARVDAWTRWRNASTGATYPLDVTIHRGWPGIQFSRVPDSTSPVPAGLESLLSPAASDRLVTPQPKRDLRPREAIR
ncbi:hypothetical protein [Haloarcula sebkhae]|uniref:Uncharacterized protein n=2 Tax=Haloarcula sebkhae TaxID=932660 RepID=A0ACC6VIK2_9EURY|nr:hypothetical protein [Haloarcula sebkhae]GGK74498.1 hypothetical protein GCM10009067_28360 [Haloarcula sebkhae]